MTPVQASVDTTRQLL